MKPKNSLRGNNWLHTILKNFIANLSSLAIAWIQVSVAVQNSLLEHVRLNVWCLDYSTQFNLTRPLSLKSLY
jgi:hypothetical protein